ncbi:MAG: SDR family oxidoreductase [Anaerolineae bacterium]
MGKLSGRVAVITGSTRGLGLGIAQAYAREGAAVVISSRSAAAVDNTVNAFLAQGVQATGVACDVADLDQVRALGQHALDSFGHYEIWVNNAGLSGPYGPTMSVAPEQFVQVTRTNTLGVYFGSLVAMQYFVPRRRGKLINMLGRGSDKPVPYQSAYASSKVWVRNFTLSVAEEYKESGVGVYAFNPGLVVTDMLENVTAIQGYDKAVRALEKVVQLWGNAPHVPAERAVWLASSATNGKTGLEVNVLGPVQVATGLLKAGARRLLGKPGRPFQLRVTAIPPYSEAEGAAEYNRG